MWMCVVASQYTFRASMLLKSGTNLLAFKWSPFRTAADLKLLGHLGKTGLVRKSVASLSQGLILLWFFPFPSAVKRVLTPRWSVLTAGDGVGGSGRGACTPKLLCSGIY